MAGLARGFLFIAVLVLVTVACGAQITVDPQRMPAATVGQSFDVPMTGNDGNPTDHPLILSVNLLKGSLPPGVSVYQSPGDGTGSGGMRARRRPQARTPSRLKSRATARWVAACALRATTPSWSIRERGLTALAQQELVEPARDDASPARPMTDRYATWTSGPADHPDRKRPDQVDALVQRRQLDDLEQRRVARRSGRTCRRTGTSAGRRAG